ncbi:hypothetical protein [Kitasatospora sp. McL0602]|uniref:hypothetical protein n=1 Tax=Kitasatospora sp. McL0602 TaxID=3439530 RepID=UPI003F8C4465
MEKAFALLVKCMFGGALRLLLEWLGVPGSVVVAVVAAGFAVWGGRALVRRRAARSGGRPVAERARSRGVTGP